jgi:Phage conserved hypothetical protein BR0599/Uncharacterized conserved protein (DUF2163)
MKNASAAAITILSGGQYLRADLYSITLVTGQTYYFTAYETPLSVAIYPSGTSNTYLSGFTINRETTTQAVGLDAQELELTMAPKWDNPGGPPTIAGYSIVQAARLGLLDNASILYSKLFANFPTPPAALDTSPNGVAWFQGVVADMDIGRFSVKIKISSNLLVLNQVQMPRNLFQGNCVHTVYDAGCTLLKSSFTVSGTVGATVTSNSNFNTNLTQASDYFDLGVITFTSGLNNGFSATVKQYLNASGNLQLNIPMPATISTGDTFSIYPGCDHLQATCTTKFSNLAHFKATPYVPVPETLYDGGTSNPTGAMAPAQQLGNLVGSTVGGQLIQTGN